MDLKTGIERVVKVCPKAKAAEAHQHVRTIPITDGKSMLYATDGIRSSLVTVDCVLPDLLLPSPDLAKVTKDPGEVEVVQVGYGKVELRTDKATYQLRGSNFDKFPPPPPVPSSDQFFYAEAWESVSKVFHAAATEKDNPELAVVSFDQGIVEATDKCRFARVEVVGSYPWAGLVPAATFKSFPKGGVWASFTATHAFFWIGDEIRASLLARSATFPDTAGGIPRKHPGPWVLVSTSDLRAAVRQGTKVSGLGLIAIEIKSEGRPVVTVRAWQERGAEAAYEGRVEVLHDADDDSDAVALVNGKYVDQILKQATTPNVKVAYGGMSDPVRFESGPLVACVWPMAYGQERGAA